MKEKIIHILFNQSMIKYYVILLLIAFAPIIAEQALRIFLNIIFTDDACYWNDGGTCPFCGW